MAAGAFQRAARRHFALTLALSISTGCAFARVTRLDGSVLRAAVIGAGFSQAGDCALAEHNTTTPTNDGNGTAEEMEVNEGGRDCATAHGGRGSNGLYATLAAGIGALVTILVTIF